MINNHFSCLVYNCMRTQSLTFLKTVHGITFYEEETLEKHAKLIEARDFSLKSFEPSY